MFVEIAVGIGIGFSIYLLIHGINILSVLIMLGLSYMMLQVLNRGNILNKPNRVMPGHHSITFDEIGGQEVAKNELLEALNFIKNFEKAKEMGIRPLKGILLTGAPGTGKTLMAKAATSYIDSVFISASGSEFIEMYAGVGAQRVRQLFQDAKNLAKKENKKHGVIFIDEIEVLAGTRGRNTGHLEYDQTLNQLLVEMDGMASSDDCDILVIAATNRPDILDPAITRPGRFDRIVKVDLPDKDGRLEILKLHTKGKPLSGDVNLEQIAKETFGFSGAHLESLCNEAAILALRKGLAEVSQTQFTEAIDKVILGEKLSRKPTDEERKRIAIHESGHALISEIFNPNSVSTVTITSRGQALGYMRQNPEDDFYLYTKEYLKTQIAVALAGAVAEEMLLGESSTGCSNDFEQASELAKQMVYSGMSELGIVDKSSLPNRILHEATSGILTEQKKVVEELVTERKPLLNIIVDYLMENEKIDGDLFRKFSRRAA